MPRTFCSKVHAADQSAVPGFPSHRTLSLLEFGDSSREQEIRLAASMLSSLFFSFLQANYERARFACIAGVRWSAEAHIAAKPLTSSFKRALLRQSRFKNRGMATKDAPCFPCLCHTDAMRTSSSTCSSPQSVPLRSNNWLLCHLGSGIVLVRVRVPEWVEPSTQLAARCNVF